MENYKFETFLNESTKGKTLFNKVEKLVKNGLSLEDAEKKVFGNSSVGWSDYTEELLNQSDKGNDLRESNKPVNNKNDYDSLEKLQKKILI